MYKEAKIFILGINESSIAVSKLLVQNNHVLLTDTKCDDFELIRNLENLGINVVITDEATMLLNETFDYVVKSYGISDDNEIITLAKKKNIKIINELEIGYHYLPKVKIIGITGSNGKTTTTNLIYEILKDALYKVHLINIDNPLCQALKDIKEGDILVTEISSHSLIYLDDFKTDISVLTNISKIHQDIYKTYENYKKIKQKIFNHHSPSEIAILNGKDKDVLEITKNILSEKIYFNSEAEADICIKNNKIYYGNEEICELNDIRLKGRHSYENVMAAIGVVKLLNVSNEFIKETLDKFSGVAHRLEFVRRFNDREFYNDSKATNNKATIAALKSFDSKIILLLGGLDRGNNFEELKDYLDNIREVICFGENKDKIVNFFQKQNKSVTPTETLDEAVKLAYNLSEAGDTILLSPASSSLDQFTSYEERGNKFKEIVESL